MQRRLQHNGNVEPGEEETRPNVCMEARMSPQNKQCVTDGRAGKFGLPKPL